MCYAVRRQEAIDVIVARCLCPLLAGSAEKAKGIDNGIEGVGGVNKGVSATGVSKIGFKASFCNSNRRWESRAPVNCVSLLEKSQQILLSLSLLDQEYGFASST
jgi:hypothetical protein